ncbi:MAG: YaaL family protein [Clostridium sp.]|nr:YaaL family protein [Clostridium sp.]
MNKGKILNFILARYEYEDTLDDNLLECIRQTIEEIEVAECMFNYASDPKLIEAAIYREDAAKKRFEYLLSLAKEKQINKKIDI